MESPLVTLCPLAAQVHRTVSPTEMLTSSGTNTSPPCPTATSTVCWCRWHTAYGRPPVLINNTQRRAVHVRCSRSLLAGFSPHQNSKRKDSCDAKNQPCCIRYFHTVGSLLCASATRFYVESQPALYGSMSGILRRHPRRRQAEFLNGRQDRGVSSVRNGNRTVTERTALNISPLSPVSSRRYSVTVMR